MKKNILTTLVACILVAALAVGGTLAYMTAKDKMVKNTFEFADGITVDVSEPEPDPTGDEEITPKDPDDPTSGYNYSNVTPGQELNKAPHVNVTTTVDAYVFVKVNGFDGDVISCGDADGNNGIGADWLKIDGQDYTNSNGIYYKTVKIDENELKTDEEGNKYYDLGDVFTKVKIGNKDIVAGEDKPTIPDITIEVSVIQMEGFTNAAEALAKAPAFQGASTEPTV